MTRFYLTTIVVTLSWLSSATAGDIYVSNVLGNDSSDGTRTTSDSDKSGPVKTIERALRIARAGDNIILHATDLPYHECVTLSGAQHSGSANRPFAIYGNGAILDGSVPVRANQWEHYRGDVHRYHPRRQTYIQLFQNEVPLTQVKVADGVPRLPQLKPMEWCYVEQKVYFRTEKGKSPSEYHLKQTGQTAGITLYRVQHVILRDLVLQGYQLDGVNAHDSVEDVQLERLTCRGNGRSGISVGGASEVVIRQSLVGNNGRAQVRAERPARLRVENSEVIANTAPAFDNHGAKLVVDGKPL